METSIALLITIISNWLSIIAKDQLVKMRKDQWPDFELIDKKGNRTLLEIKSRKPDSATLEFMSKKLSTLSDSSAQFVLITPISPTKKESKRFKDIFQGIPNKVSWLSLDDLPTLLGKPSPGPWDSPSTWSELQTNALIKGLEAYQRAPIGLEPYSSEIPANNLEALSRQFSYESIANINTLPGNLESKLGLGSRQENVTVVLSDIVNFSSLVTASRPDVSKRSNGSVLSKSSTGCI